MCVQTAAGSGASWELLDSDAESVSPSSAIKAPSVQPSATAPSISTLNPLKKSLPRPPSSAVSAMGVGGVTGSAAAAEGERPPIQVRIVLRLSVLLSFSARCLLQRMDVLYCVFACVVSSLLFVLFPSWFVFLFSNPVSLCFARRRRRRLSPACCMTTRQRRRTSSHCGQTTSYKSRNSTTQIGGACHLLTFNSLFLFLYNRLCPVISPVSLRLDSSCLLFCVCAS